MDIVYTCWKFRDLLGDLVHLDGHGQSLEEASIKTKTKVGKKRIEDINLTLFILRDLEKLNSLIEEGISSQRKYLESRRLRLAEDPSLAHTDQLQSCEEQYVSHVEGTQEGWKQGINSINAINSNNGTKRGVNCITLPTTSMASIAATSAMASIGYNLLS